MWHRIMLPGRLAESKREEGEVLRALAQALNDETLIVFNGP